VESENRFVKLKLTAKGLRIVDKKGIDTVLTDRFG
jgi:large subunit ribosomal protein L28